MIVDAFLLMVYLGVGDARQLVSNQMYFYNINECNYFASKVAKRYGNYVYSAHMDKRDRVTAYCIPAPVNKEEVRIY